LGSAGGAAVAITNLGRDGKTDIVTGNPFVSVFGHVSGSFFTFGLPRALPLVWFD
jgi:hypothetical protein